MDRTTELELIDELLELKANKSPFLDEHEASHPIDPLALDVGCNH